MSALICAACKRVIGTYAAPQRWFKGQPYHPGKCLESAKLDFKSPLEVRPFNIGGVTFLRCPDCQSACVMSASTESAKCRCGRVLESDYCDHEGVPDKDTPSGNFGWFWNPGYIPPVLGDPPTATEVVARGRQEGLTLEMMRQMKAKCKFIDEQRGDLCAVPVGELVDKMVEDTQRSVREWQERVLRDHSDECPRVAVTSPGPNAKTYVAIMGKAMDLWNNGGIREGSRIRLSKGFCDHGLMAGKCATVRTPSGDGVRIAIDGFEGFNWIDNETTVEVLS